MFDDQSITTERSTRKFSLRHDLFERRACDENEENNRAKVMAYEILYTNLSLKEIRCAIFDESEMDTQSLLR